MLKKLSLIVFLSFLFIGIGLAQNTVKVYGNISDQFGNLPGARVFIEGEGTSTSTDINGNYTMEMIPGEYIITASFTLYKTVSKTITVIDGIELRVDFLLETGFSVNQSVSIDSKSINASLFNASSPIEIVTAQDIANSSQYDLSQVLQYLVPSFHSARQTISDGTDHVDPAALRGLGPDQILVLINGKRRHNSALLHVNGTVGRGTAGIDFNAIPITAIDKIEILRDGGTAQYGSDAIAGVINIILKEDINETVVFAKNRINTEGDGYTYVLGANSGFKIGKKGFANLTGEYRNRESTNRSGNYTGTVYTDDVELDNQLIEENDFFGQTGFSDRRIIEAGNAATENLSIALNSEIEVSENTSFYLYGLRNSRIGKSRGFYRLPKDQLRVVAELYPNGFSPQIVTNSIDNSLYAGFKKERNGWSVDFSHGIGANRIDFNIFNSNNASLGVDSPRNFFAGTYRYTQHATNLDISKEINWLNGVTISFGGELRRENYTILPGEEASYIDGGVTYTNSEGEEVPRIAGSQVFPGISPDNAISRSRTSNSIFYQVDAKVTDKWFVKAAGRSMSGRNVFDGLIWKLSSRYNFNENFGLRVGYNTGRRPPSLHQLYFQNIGTQFISTGPAQIGTFNSESEVARAFGTHNIKPESSTYFSAGFNGKIADKFTFSFNYYDIRIRDRIVLSGRVSEGFDEILDPLQVDIAQLFTNALDSRTNGFDATFGYQASIGRGRFSTTLTGNITETEIRGKINVPEPFVEAGLEDIFFSREEIARVVSSQPRSKFISTFTYDINKFRFLARNTYFGTVLFIFPLDVTPNDFVVNDFTGLPQSRDQKFSSKILTDMSVSYKLNNSIDFTIGGNNIFDIYPDKINHSALTGRGKFIYSRRVQQFNVNGANYFIGFQAKF